MEPIRIMHFSDALCVWAYVSQVRIDELLKTFTSSVQVEYRYLHVFGDVHRKLDASWKDRGGLRGYDEHVTGVCARFEHVALAPHAWVRAAPRSSMPCHLLLCAVRLLESEGRVAAGTLARAAWAVREAFFKQGGDISHRATLLQVAETMHLPMAELERVLDSGAAHAELCGDLDLARTHGIQASPTLLFNEGRQRLSGNVGYRIIEANIRELLEGAPGQASWC